MDGLNVGFNKVTGMTSLYSTGSTSKVENNFNIPIGKATKPLSSDTMAALENPTDGFMFALNKMSGLIDFSA